MSQTTTETRKWIDVAGADGISDGEVKTFQVEAYRVAVARANGHSRGHLICIDGTKKSFESMRRDAVLAQHCGDLITLFAVARQKGEITTAERVLEKAKAMLAKMEIEVAGTEIGVGNPTEQIVKVGNDFSVIAVADSGKTWPRRFVINNISFNVMGAASTSVLKIR